MRIISKEKEEDIKATKENTEEVSDEMPEMFDGEIFEEKSEDAIIFDDLIERPRSEYSMSVYKNLNIVYDYRKDADIMNIERTCNEEEEEFFNTADNEFENIKKLNTDLNNLLNKNENTKDDKKNKKIEKIEKNAREFVIAYLTFSERCYDFLSTCGDDNVLLAEKMAEKTEKTEKIEKMNIENIKNKYFFNVYIMLEKLKEAVTIAKEVYKVAKERDIQLYPNPDDLLNKTAKLPYLFSSEPFEVLYDIEVFNRDIDEAIYFGIEAFYRSLVQDDKYHARDEQLITFMRKLEELSKTYYANF